MTLGRFSMISILIVTWEKKKIHKNLWKFDDCYDDWGIHNLWGQWILWLENLYHFIIDNIIKWYTPCEAMKYYNFKTYCLLRESWDVWARHNFRVPRIVWLQYLFHFCYLKDDTENYEDIRKLLKFLCCTHSIALPFSK